MGVKYMSNGEGQADGIAHVLTGYGVQENDAHAVVVHDTNGVRILCGVLKSVHNGQAACTVNINDCVANECTNGGKCEDLVNDFACACPSEYYGPMCEFRHDDCGDAETASELCG